MAHDMSHNSRPDRVKGASRRTLHAAVHELGSTRWSSHPPYIKGPSLDLPRTTMNRAIASRTHLDRSLTSLSWCTAESFNISSIVDYTNREEYEDISLKEALPRNSQEKPSISTVHLNPFSVDCRRFTPPFGARLVALRSSPLDLLKDISLELRIGLLRERKVVAGSSIFVNCWSISPDLFEFMVRRSKLDQIISELVRISSELVWISSELKSCTIADR
ncbi:abscisic acid 8'-hydroxylase 4-like [Dorcoceras hygrometricum]|uniref:Abscisic acid 8'-hydroxylase 4-like n=1 Tax=Dorcoceras hygrometricum TaxID=472368 RepID=A0A2Z7C3Z0_9LAMI|nr:abscisic acid 8'-hydroxylase 4-like [Dorcoceras hygrometricum]